MKALLLIDIQNDFLPGGALAVPNGDAVVHVANRLMPKYPLVVATQDWHPADHSSFARRHPGRQVGESVVVDGVDQVLSGQRIACKEPQAQFAPDLNTAGVHHVIHKGTDPKIDSYSGFFDNARRTATGLEDLLREKGVDEVHILGLATEYCVKATALDAVDLGFRTVVLTEGVRGVDLQEGDSGRALEAMHAAGVAVN